MLGDPQGKRKEEETRQQPSGFRRRRKPPHYFALVKASASQAFSRPQFSWEPAGGRAGPHRGVELSSRDPRADHLPQAGLPAAGPAPRKLRGCGGREGGQGKGVGERPALTQLGLDGRMVPAMSGAHTQDPRRGSWPTLTLRSPLSLTEVPGGGGAASSPAWAPPAPRRRGERIEAEPRQSGQRQPGPGHTRCCSSPTPSCWCH